MGFFDFFTDDVLGSAIVAGTQLVSGLLADDANEEIREQDLALAREQLEIQQRQQAFENSLALQQQAQNLELAALQAQANATGRPEVVQRAFESAGSAERQNAANIANAFNSIVDDIIASVR